MKRFGLAVALGALAVVGCSLGITNHVYSLQMSSFGHLSSLPVVGANGGPVTFRTFEGAWLVAGLIAFAMLGAFVVACLTVEVRRRRGTGIELTGQLDRSARRAARPAAHV